MRSVVFTIAFLALSAFGSSSLFAQSGLGNTGTSGLTGAGFNNFNSTNTGTTGTTGTGTTSTNRSSTGTTGTTGTGAAGTTGTNTATQNFIGGNATENFVGGSRQATNQQGTNRQFQAFQNTQQGMNQGTSATGTPRQVKTALRIGFSFPNATAAQSSGQLANANQVNLSRYVTSRPEFTGISVNMTSEGVAVLTGAADSMESSRLAANLMRLQPGVRRVDNQIGVNR